MPIYNHKQPPFTKTFTTTLKQLQLIECLMIFPNIQFKVRSSVDTSVTYRRNLDLVR